MIALVMNVSMVLVSMPLHLILVNVIPALLVLCVVKILMSVKQLIVITEHA